MASINERVTILERNVSIMQNDIHAVTATSRENGAKLDTLIGQTEVLVSAVAIASGTAGYVKRYGPRVITFGAGLFTAAGIGNPNVWKFLSTFFG